MARNDGTECGSIVRRRRERPSRRASGAPQDEARVSNRIACRPCHPQPWPRSLVRFVMRAAWLVVQRRARQPAGLKRMQGRRVGHVERVKATAQHERNFVDQHVADRPEFAAELTPVAQDAGVGKRAAVGELVEGERDQRPVREVGQMRLRVGAGLDRDSDRGYPRRQRLALLKPALERDDDRALLGDGKPRRRETPICLRRSLRAATKASDA